MRTVSVPTRGSRRLTILVRVAYRQYVWVLVRAHHLQIFRPSRHGTIVSVRETREYPQRQVQDLRPRRQKLLERVAVAVVVEIHGKWTLLEGLESC